MATTGLTSSKKFNWEELADDIQRVILPILFTEVETDENIYVEFIVGDVEDVQEDGAFILHLDNDEGTHFFEVEFAKSLLNDKEAFKRVVCHELVHVMQELRGDVYAHWLPYMERPQEIEAYDLEDWLLFYYNMERQ